MGLLDEIRVWNRLFFYQDIFPRDYGILQKMREGDVSHCDRYHMISIIVPVYNGENSIGNCLNSIFVAKIDVPFEVIVVDDGSTDQSGKVAKQFPCRYFRIEKSGVAAARNFGIEKAKGDIVFFFDADVRLKEETIQTFLKHFKEDGDAFIIQGRWDKNSPSPTISSRFLLLKYAYPFIGLFNGKRRIEVANLETGCLGMRAEIFDSFGGFDETYKFSGGEEHEFGMRLLDKYKIFYYSDLHVEHLFGSILGTLKKIYRRTINFSMLSFKAGSKKNFMNLHKNSVPIQDKTSVVIVFLLVCGSFLFFFDAKIAVGMIALLFLTYFIVISKFLLFLMSEENIFFAAIGAIFNLIIMFPRLFGLLRAAYVFYVLGAREFRV